MKTIFRLLSFLMIILSFSCGGDEGPSFSFIDQEASGKIDNVSWMYADGYASIDDYGDGDIELSVDLALAQTEEGCNIFIPEGDMVFFSVPNKVGLYKLKFDLSNWTGQTVTLFKESETENFLATEGAIEILSISETVVSGRLDARYDNQTYVNGNFTVSICQ